MFCKAATWQTLFQFIGAVCDVGATVFTDHSLFGFADASAIVTNAFLKYVTAGDAKKG